MNKLLLLFLITPLFGLSQNPNAVKYYNEAVKLSSAKDYPSAIKAYTASIGEDPKYAIAYYGRDYRECQ